MKIYAMENKEVNARKYGTVLFYKNRERAAEKFKNIKKTIGAINPFEH